MMGRTSSTTVAPVLGELCGGRENNLNLIRAIAATLVLVSHSVPVTRGMGTPEPLEALTGSSLGSLAVAIFFVISGFLIARSFDRRPSGWHWLSARVLRLFPGLAVVLALTALVLGPAVTRLGTTLYFSTPGTWTYLPLNLILYPGQYPLPGVFLDNPYGPPINGSLWTLKYEVLCYVGVVIAGAAGMLRRPGRFALGLVGFGLLYTAVAAGYGFGIRGFIVPAMQLALPFAIGMAAYVWRDRLRLDWRIVGLVWAVAAIARFTPVFTPLYMLAIAYTTLILAYRPKGALLHYNRIGDYSYGIYVYAFPIQQLVVHLNPGITPLGNIALALPPTLVCAILSWHLVEKRALALAKPTAERWMTFWRREGLGVTPERPA